MALAKLLIANRGEIAIRIAHAAATLSISTVAVFSADDAASLHTRQADAMHALPGIGPAAYLDIDAILHAAITTGSCAIHPGYGLLSENAALARRCAQAGLHFVGPTAETLALLGDKTQARAAAAALGIPVARATGSPATPAHMHDFVRTLPPGGRDHDQGRRGRRRTRHADGPASGRHRRRPRRVRI